MARQKRKKNHSAGKPVRFSLPDDEKQHLWLRMLLDAYHVLDKGVFKSIEAARNKGRELACEKGCSNCCSALQDIPVYPLELVGISWYAAEKVAGTERGALRKQLGEFKRGRPCPFLLEGICSIHPVRPMACRQFNVFKTPCAEGEDPFHTRRHDVMDPVTRHVDQAFFIMLPYHGIEKESDRITFIESGRMHAMARELHGCNWRLLAERMERVDNPNP